MNTSNLSFDSPSQARRIDPSNLTALALFAALTLLSGSRPLANAQDNPPGCNGVGVFVNLSRSPGVITNGGTVTYNISVGNNDDPAASLKACNAESIRV